MKQVLEVFGVLLLIQGVAALAHELTGRFDGWGVVRRIGFLDGYEIYASVTLIVLAFALFAAAESRKGR
ncbi:hypothetical protein [Streptomyces sp. MZ04]|uniref:hypothetical protein n=1 Tax=Streptomyces sp. MZ04 TaxID=2559236 RepID=UPI00107EA343|nr:hypothetical protein [Streptomyces sp. MZ04]TGA99362.1 hypothetical protein E2651_29575 [Streptomyces sp. MZ04]